MTEMLLLQLQKETIKCYRKIVKLKSKNSIFKLYQTFIYRFF